MALPNDILRTINELQRRLTNLETNPQPPNISISSAASATFALAATGDGAGGDVVSLTASLANADNKRLLGTPHISIYKSSVSTANQWPDGSNWAVAEKRNIDVSYWLDWGDTDNNNIKFKLLLVNRGATAYATMLIRVNFRYLLRTAAL